MDKKWSEQKDKCRNDDSLQSEQGQSGAGETEGFVGLFAAVAHIEIDGRAVAEEDRERAAQECERISDGGGGIAKETDPLTNEHLIHHIVEGGDQSGDNAGNSILKQKAANRGGAQRIRSF